MSSTNYYYLDSETQPDNDDVDDLELGKFLGHNTDAANNLTLKLSDAIPKRVRGWLNNGISRDDKKKKLKIILRMPRTGNELNLEPPNLDQAIASSKLVQQYNYLKNYKNLVSGALAASASAFNDLFYDPVKPVNRQELLG